MGTRERDEQAEAEREQQEQLQQQQQERLNSPRAIQADGENETSNNPVIINK